MNTPRTPLASLMGAYVIGLVYFLIQQLLLVEVLGNINHPLALLASAPDPLLALAVWNLAERGLCVLLVAWPAALLLRQLPAPRQSRFIITLSAAIVAGTLAGLSQHYFAPPVVFPLWVRLVDTGLIIIALPVLNARVSGEKK